MFNYSSPVLCFQKEGHETVTNDFYKNKLELKVGAKKLFWVSSFKKVRIW